MLTIASTIGFQGPAQPKWNSSPELQREKVSGPRAHEKISVADLYAALWNPIPPVSCLPLICY